MCVFPQDEEMHTGALAMLKEAAQAGCLQSSYLLWDQNYKASVSLNPLPDLRASFSVSSTTAWTRSGSGFGF